MELETETTHQELEDHGAVVGNLELETIQQELEDQRLGSRELGAGVGDMCHDSQELDDRRRGGKELGRLET